MLEHSKAIYLHGLPTLSSEENTQIEKYLATANSLLRAFRFERPQVPTSSYIEFGVLHESARRAAGRRALYAGFKRLEAAWQADLGHDFEITKQISVRLWAPLALFEFREQGSFMFDVPEIFFDMDYPGYHMHVELQPAHRDARLLQHY